MATQQSGQASVVRFGDSDRYRVSANDIAEAVKKHYFITVGDTGTKTTKPKKKITGTYQIWKSDNPIKQNTAYLAYWVDPVQVTPENRDQHVHQLRLAGTKEAIYQTLLNIGYAANTGDPARGELNAAYALQFAIDRNNWNNPNGLYKLFYALWTETVRYQEEQKMYKAQKYSDVQELTPAELRWARLQYSHAKIKPAQDAPSRAAKGKRLGPRRSKTIGEKYTELQADIATGRRNANTWVLDVSNMDIATGKGAKIKELGDRARGRRARNPQLMLLYSNSIDRYIAAIRLLYGAGQENNSPYREAIAEVAAELKSMPEVRPQNVGMAQGGGMALVQPPQTSVALLNPNTIGDLISAVDPVANNATTNGRLTPPPGSVSDPRFFAQAETQAIPNYNQSPNQVRQPATQAPFLSPARARPPSQPLAPVQSFVGQPQATQYASQPQIPAFNQQPIMPGQSASAPPPGYIGQAFSQ